MLSGLTYNVFLGRNLEELLMWLRGDNALQDFYCFQEFPEKRIADIKRHFGQENYDFHFAPGFRWRGITYGELTVFNKDTLKLMSAKNLSLGGKGELNLVFIREGRKFDVKLARIQIDRSALITTFQHGARQFSLVNAHLCADIHNRRKLKQLTRIALSLKEEMPAIVLGDFNYPFGKGLSGLMTRHGFIAAFKRLKTFRFAPGIYWQNDYIFQRGCTVKDVEMKRVPHSDHFPIFFKVQ